MARPSRIAEKREELLPLVAGAFSELGYRRATTAEIAARCGVRENILYRLWRDKKAMFLAAIDFLFSYRISQWRDALRDLPGGESRARHLIRATASTPGGEGLYRVIFAALNETHDPEIRDALWRMYAHFHAQVVREVAAHRGRRTPRGNAADADTAWSMIALATFMNVAVDLDLLGPRKRPEFFVRMAELLLDQSPG